MSKHKAVIAIGLFTIICLPLPVYSYRIGDAVGIIIRTNKHKQLETFRHQMPRFGWSTKTKIETQVLLDATNNYYDLKFADDARIQRQQQQQHHDSDRIFQEESRLSLSLQLDEGLHHTSAIDVFNRSTGKALHSLVINFVYSSSDGSIHSVQQDAQYQQILKNGARKNEIPRSFTVEYIWIEEADVDIDSGVFVLFTIICYFALFGMVSVCRGINGNVNNEKGYVTPRKEMPKVEGYAKKL